MSQRNRACLSLGSNLEPLHYLPRAVQGLMRLGQVASVSRVWQSAAIGALDQPDYCNAAVLLLTDTSAEELIDAAGPLRQLEAELDRVRDPLRKSAPRTIDIDLTLYNCDDRTVGRKQVPDPDLFERACIAVPLAELPGVELPPGRGVCVLELAARLSPLQIMTPRPDIDAAIARVLEAQEPAPR